MNSFSLFLYKPGTRVDSYKREIEAMPVAKGAYSIVGWKYLLTGESGNLQIAIQLYSNPEF